MSALPLSIFTLATSPYDDWHAMAWGASFIVLVLVLSLNLLAKLVTVRWKVQS